MSEITITVNWTDLDWICHWAHQYLEEKQFLTVADYDEVKQRIARVRQAMELGRKYSNETLDKALRKE